MNIIALFFLTASILIAAPTIKVTQTFKGQNIKLPVALAIPPDGTERLFLVQQFGKITILPNDRSSDEEITFLDVTDRPLIKQQFEEGILGLAFHPDYAKKSEVLHLLFTPRPQAHPR